MAAGETDHNGLFSFNQWVASGGYAWIGLSGQTGNPNGRLLEPLPSPKDAIAYCYNPYAKPQLYSDFAGLYEEGASQEELERRILGFANRNGLLGPVDSSGRPLSETSLDSYEAWMKEIIAMNTASRLLHLLVRCRQDELRKEDSSAVDDLRRLMHTGRTVTRSLHISEGELRLRETESFNPPTDGQIVLEAEWLVRAIANIRLQDHCHPVMKAPGAKGSPWGFATRELLGAIWLQFSYHVVGKRSFNICEQCGKLFLVGPEVRRSHAKWCTETCRVENWRARKRKKLRHCDEEGVSPNEQ